ncbi:MAG: bifunctional ornithine acetyltransferase/N-acetylglutamate synthase, partial [Verrucomicrobiota bacterium]
MYSDRDCDVAGVFTSNKLKGWHVFLCQDRISKGEKIRAVVVNSGNANACNGQQGRKDAEKTAELAAGRLSVDSRNVMVCSTGTIGIPLPMDKIEAGIAVAAGSLDEADGFSAASAILTTDTVEKQGAVELSIDNRPVRIGAMAKGSGMIEPNMATMLAFFTTDAVVESEALSACLSEAADMSFNKISVDGDQSCNDSVLFMANGVAGNRP